MTPQNIKKRIKELKDDIPNFEKLQKLTNEKGYESLINDYKNELISLQSHLDYIGIKSKGVCDKSEFGGKPFLIVRIDKTYNMRNLYDSIRRWWNISEKHVEKLVYNNGFVVGVIKKVVFGVVQIDGFERGKENSGDKLVRVAFIGKLVSKHSSIHKSFNNLIETDQIKIYNFD